MCSEKGDVISVKSSFGENSVIISYYGNSEISEFTFGCEILSLKRTFDATNIDEMKVLVDAVQTFVNDEYKQRILDFIKRYSSIKKTIYLHPNPIILKHKQVDYRICLTYENDIFKFKGRFWNFKQTSFDAQDEGDIFCLGMMIAGNIKEIEKARNFVKSFSPVFPSQNEMILKVFPNKQ